MTLRRALKFNECIKRSAAGDFKSLSFCASSLDNSMIAAWSMFYQL
jgi:hypothetical protein